jgi:hypothetical protein
MKGPDFGAPKGARKRAFGRHMGRRVASGAIITSMLTVLLAAAVVGVGIVAMPVFGVVLKGLLTQDSNDPRVCAAIKNDKDRLSCFDRYADGLLTPPAKGAFAPVLERSTIQSEPR